MKYLLAALFTTSLFAQTYRPDQAVSFKELRKNGTMTLLAFFHVDRSIAQSRLQNVEGWCNTQLPHEMENPYCVLEAKDPSGEITELQVRPYQNSVTANISVLQENTPYKLTLVETSSRARSLPATFTK